MIYYLDFSVKCIHGGLVLNTYASFYGVPVGSYLKSDNRPQHGMMHE